MYKTILFDADGTLLDFEQSQRNAVIHVFRKYGIPCTDEHISIYNQINQGLWEQFERGEIPKQQIIATRFHLALAEIGVPHPAGDGLEKDYQMFLSQGHELMEGAEEICRYCRRFCRLYIVTNGLKITQETRLKASGLDQYFDGVFISDEIGFQKPQKEYFEYVYRAIGEPDKREILIVGDSLSSDIQGGNVFGIDTCLLNTSGKQIQTDLRINYEIRQLSDLKTILV